MAQKWALGLILGQLGNELAQKLTFGPIPGQLAMQWLS